MSDGPSVGPLAEIGGRKFVLAVLLLAASTFLLWFGRIEASVWREVAIAISGIYVAGNVWAKFSPEAKKK